MTTFLEATSKDSLFEVVLFDEKITSDKKFFTDSILGFWNSIYVDNDNIGDDIKEKYNNNFFKSNDTALKLYLDSIKAMPETVEDVPVKWIIEIDSWSLATTGDFSALQDNVDELLEYLRTLTNTSINKNIDLKDEENLED